MLFKKFIIPMDHMFFHPEGERGHVYKFSSDLDKIGTEWDVAIANGTYVEVISDPIEITRPQYGQITVIKVKADVARDYHTIIKEFFVPAFCIIKSVDYAVKSPELAN